jgi:hypothetical protein
MKLDQTFRFYTDTATLAIFDPLVLEHRKDAFDWFSQDFSTLPEVTEGLIALVAISNDGYYQVRVTDELSSNEKNFAREVTPRLGLVSKSGHIFIGQGEFLPADGLMPTLEDLKSSTNMGSFIDLPPGEYDLLVYLIDAEGYVSQSVSMSMPDLVIVITKRMGQFQPIKEEPRINLGVDTFLFPSTENKNKPKPRVGKMLTGVVFKTDRTPSGLIIKQKNTSWPRSYDGYEIRLKDMTLVEWQDRVKFKTIEVDLENKIIYAEFIEKNTI